MILQFADGEPFAVGATTYLYAPATDQDISDRIQLPIVCELTESTDVLAVVDTGSPYSILDPLIAKQIGFSPEMALERTAVTVRGAKLRGSLIRLSTTLQAEVGENLTIDSTTFIPDSEEQWNQFPSFIGQAGFLERIRFAIDPNTNTFYFGSP